MSEISIDLDTIVSALKRVVQYSTNEEGIRDGVVSILEGILSVLGLGMKKYTYSFVSGVRPDALYKHVLIAYKAPGSLSTTGFSLANQQIIKYIMGEADSKENLKDYFGIIISDKIAFVNYGNGDWVVRGPYDVTRKVVLNLVGALRGLKRKRLSVNKLLNDFGSKSELALNTIHILYDRLEKTNNQKVELFFQDWVTIFSHITGYCEKDLKGLDQFYDTAGKDYTKLLFCIHTYYAVFVKLMAVELAYLYGSKYGTSFAERIQYIKVEEFKKSMKKVEEGDIVKKLLQIKNFCEAGYFSWYLEEVDHELMGAIAGIAQKLADYECATPVLEPEETKDLLKSIYQGLIPRSIRHNLGEYYTPDWLAQFLLNEVDFTLDFFEELAKDSDVRAPLHLRLLDPACGSGTFLCEALKRLRQYAEKHSISDILPLYVLKNVVGMDLNPLAVLAAKTNYLLTVGDLLHFTHEIELPIYVADSIRIKSTDGNTFIQTQAGEVEIPSRIKENVENLLELIKECVTMGYTLEEFECKLTRTMKDLCESEIKTIKNLYTTFLDLKKEEKVYMLNAFAPLVIGTFDFVVGNPPWIVWDNLPPDYRESTHHVWKDYNLFTLTASQARHGGGKKDISILFTYVCNDRYLKNSGVLGFVITQSVFKTKGAGEGFRQFALDNYGLTVVKVHDFVHVNPFEGANNRTTALILRKGAKTVYPVPYTVWRKGSVIDQKDSLALVLKKLQSVTMAAIPSDPENELSPWITVPGDAVHIVKKVYGKNAYAAHAGINSGGANGVYWLTLLDLVTQYKKTVDTPQSLRKILGITNEIIAKEILVENVTKGAKRKVEKTKTVIEDFFIYPLLKSRNVRKWRIDGYTYSLQMQDPLKRSGFDEEWVKMNFPKTYAYLKSFETVLKERKSKSLRQLLKKGPFFTMYAVGVYTYAPYKVVWNRMGSDIAACVVSTVVDEFLGEKLVLPENVLAFIPVYNEDEAYYICAVMNASITDMILCSIAGGTKSFGTPKIIEDTIRIVQYDGTNELHKNLVALSKKAHYNAKDEKKIMKIEKEIDGILSEIYRISEKDAETVKKTLLIQKGEFQE